jgi:6-phosphogluconolactonase (cycloisomerase 2 family)
MYVQVRAALAVLAATGALAGAHAAAAAARDTNGGHAVFVQTNRIDGNSIVVYDRADDGTLTEAGTYATGGLGGIAAGAPSDHLASQGSLVFDARHELLFAVNAGSDSLSVFRVDGDALTLQQVVPSGGGFPASIAVHDNLLYVLNAGGLGVVQGFRIDGHQLHRIPGSARTLGLANTDPPFFLNSPGQVGFTPGGEQLIVTTKGSGSTIDVFGVSANGRLSPTPVRNAAATPVPFAFTFEPSSQRLVDGEAGISAVSTYVVGSDGALSDPHSLSDGQAALCWITRVRGYYYVSNTGSNDVSGYTIGANGQPALVGPTGVVAVTEPGPIDSTASADEFLYVETGVSGTVDEFHVAADGTLTRIGTVTGLPPGLEGIASS